jgi:DNA polymerase-1
MLSIDTETTSIYPAQADIVGIALAWPDAVPAYIPIQGPTNQSDRLISLDNARAVLSPFLHDASIAKVGQNLKYDLIVFANHGFQLSNVSFDTIIADYLCSPGERNHSLDELAKKTLAHSMIPITDLIGTGKNQCLMCDVDIDRVTEYAAEDADVALKLIPTMQQNLQAMSLEDVFTSLEMPLVQVLADIERIGIAIDVDTLTQLRSEFEGRVEELRERIFTVAERRFNPDSPKQLAQLLFDDLGLRVVKRTKSGPSTDVDVLQELALEHPLPAIIIEYRQITKLKSTYVDALPKLINPKTDRIHSSFRQDVAATGRLSSTDPNLQNIPIRTEEGRRIRSAFKPGYQDWLLLAADYSQIELRIMAHECDDETLKAAFDANEDIHTTVAAQIYNVSAEDVTANQRRNAKAVNFGILYGQSPFGLAKAIGIPKGEAAVFIDEYFAKFSKVRAFMLDTLAKARRDGFVATMSGRRRYLKGIRDFSKLNDNQQKTLLEPERMAVNTVIQGSAADLIKLAMIRIWRRMKESKFRANMLLQIHDELVFEVHQEDAEEFSELVRYEMVNAMKLNVPLVVDVKTGKTWADC